MPEEPRNGGTYLIQNKATGTQLGLPDRSMLGVFKEHYIVPRDQGAVWEIEFVTIADCSYCFRFKTVGPFPWSNLDDPDSDFGSLTSDLERHVYARRPSNGEFEIWQPEPGAGSYFSFVNRATGLALDETNGEIHTRSPNFHDFQQWGFFRADPNAL
jgi:hypothetical protein